jgi:Protein of unknown function (DUF2911)
MKTLKSLPIMLIAVLCLWAANIKADEWNKETKITFSGPVLVENTQLPAGTYVFKLADTADRHVVQIFNEDQTQVIATILAIPDYRIEPTGHTVVKFSESNDGSETSGAMPDSGIPIKEWFYPGDNFGQEFRVVPQPQVAVAEPAPAPPPPAPVAAEPAPAEPPPQPEAAPSCPCPAAAPPPAPAPAPEPVPLQLPQTASELPLLGLIGFVSLASAVFLGVKLGKSA